MTLTDGTSNAFYAIAGAAGSAVTSDRTGQFVATDTSFFNVLGPNGGVVATVATVDHMSPGGQGFAFDVDTRTAPED